MSFVPFGWEINKHLLGNMDKKLWPDEKKEEKKLMSQLQMWWIQTLLVLQTNESFTNCKLPYSPPSHPPLSSLLSLLLFMTRSSLSLSLSLSPSTLKLHLHKLFWLWSAGRSSCDWVKGRRRVVMWYSRNSHAAHNFLRSRRDDPKTGLAKILLSKTGEGMTFRGILIMDGFEIWKQWNYYL